jgi:hypothetical protein
VSLESCADSRVLLRKSRAIILFTSLKWSRTLLWGYRIFPAFHTRRARKVT